MPEESEASDAEFNNERDKIIQENERLFDLIKVVTGLVGTGAVAILTFSDVDLLPYWCRASLGLAVAFAVGTLAFMILTLYVTPCLRLKRLKRLDSAPYSDAHKKLISRITSVSTLLIVLACLLSGASLAIAVVLRLTFVSSGE